jgi:L-aspartate oxidase
MSRIDRVERSAVVVVGAGAAGLTVALGCHDRPVVLLARGAPGKDGASAMAQGGIAAAVGPADEPRRHAVDTLAAGDGLASPSVVDLLTAGAPEAIEGLVELGVTFDRDPAGALELGREAAHDTARIVHAAGDGTEPRSAERSGGPWAAPPTFGSRALPRTTFWCRGAE